MSNELVDIEGKIKQIIADLGVNIPSNVQSIIDTLITGIQAVQGLVPTDKKAEVEGIEQSVLKILEASAVVESEISKLVNYKKQGRENPATA